MNDNKLILCPFCGSLNLSVRLDDWVTCRNCRVYGPTATETENAAERWNTRAGNEGYIKALVTECGMNASLQYIIDEQARKIDRLTQEGFNAAKSLGHEGYELRCKIDEQAREIERLKTLTGLKHEPAEIVQFEEAEKP
jgi:hypothetical protein